MKAPLVPALCLCGLLCFAQSNKQIPKGIHEAEQATAAAENSIPPPSMPPLRNPKQLQQDADELARLANTIPAAVEQVNHGILPKDLNERLRRIEKLSKHVRSELSSY